MFAPDDIMPAIIARLIIREGRWPSRAAPIAEPLGKSAANDAPRRAQYSGVSSMLTRPTSPYEENRPRL